MTDFNTKFLALGSKINPFLAMTEAGVSSLEIKNFIISELSPYFENTHIVEEHSVGLLATELITLYKIRIQGDEYLLNSVLKIYRTAKKK